MTACSSPAWESHHLYWFPPASAHLDAKLFWRRAAFSLLSCCKYKPCIHICKITLPTHTRICAHSNTDIYDCLTVVHMHPGSHPPSFCRKRFVVIFAYTDVPNHVHAFLYAHMHAPTLSLFLRLKCWARGWHVGIINFLPHEATAPRQLRSVRHH